MGDGVIGNRPTNVQGATTPVAAKPPAKKATSASDFNPAAKAMLDDNVRVASKAGKGAVPAVQLQEADQDVITQADMTMSASRESASTDQELNAAYQALTATLDPASKAKLVTAEKAWITFRDAETDFQAAPYQGGTMYPMMAMAANGALNQQRTTDLTGWKAMRDTAGPDGPAAAKEGAAQRAKTADKALNVAYKHLAANLDPAGKAKLLTAQKAWLAFRDAECAFAGPAMKDATLAELTEARTKDLQNNPFDP
jgi:uncharacterized protein YecT (DUF1311 family)